MSKRWFLLIPLVILVVLGLAAAGWAWYARPQKTEVTIDVYAGTPGLAFKGTADVDGSPRELNGTVPQQFVLEGYRVTYTFTSAEDSGEFRVRSSTGGVALGSSTSGDPPKRGVRGWVKSSWGGAAPNNWIESFDKDEDKGWMRSPP